MRHYTISWDSECSVCKSHLYFHSTRNKPWCYHPLWISHTPQQDSLTHSFDCDAIFVMSQSTRPSSALICLWRDQWGQPRDQWGQPRDQIMKCGSLGGSLTVLALRATLALLVNRVDAGWGGTVCHEAPRDAVVLTRALLTLRGLPNAQQDNRQSTNTSSPVQACVFASFCMRLTEGPYNYYRLLQPFMSILWSK